MGKIKGIEITDLTIGTGAEATQEDCVAVNVRMFLRRGDEVHFSPALGPRMVIVLSRRDAIAGLLKGIPGMRIGGLRQILISPHLAYGEVGIPGRIPPNALLRCEVELVATRDHCALLPEDYLPGKLIRISKPNSQNYSVPHWTFEIHENGHSMLTFPVPGSMPVRWSQIAMVLDPAKAGSLIQLALDAPHQLPEDCILWDSGRLNIPRGNRPVTDKLTQAPCIVLNINERNERILDYAVPETSEKFLQSPLLELLNELVSPHLNSPIESSSQV
jgi:hypothetical protein